MNMRKLIILFFVASFLAICSVDAQRIAPPAGYTYGTSKVTASPFSMQELQLLQQSLLFGEDDIKYLRMSRDILKDQTNDILDVWYGFVASTPQLVYFFGNKNTGKPDGPYLAKVRERFSQWILQTAQANYDQTWLNYQYEIGLRHYKTKKNKTDSVQSVPIVNYRYIPALTIPITTTLKPFLAKKGASEMDVENMYQAWVKTVLMQSILWAQPYIKHGEF